MAAKKFEHPAIDHLAVTPDIFHALLTGVSDKQAYWKPALDRFSIAELLEHISHVEAHYFRIHVDAILAGANPEIEPYDQNAYYALGAYSNRDAEESMAHWEEQRADNVDLLRGLEPGRLSRTARHTEVG